jgi:hypothetical protein
MRDNNYIDKNDIASTLKNQFDEFVFNCKENFFFQKKIIENNQKQYGIDRYLYYENLESELNVLINELGIKEKPKHALWDFKLKKFENKQFTKNLLDQKNIDIIYKEANFFFNKFNYSKAPPAELLWGNNFP